jgi:hypothetical protein
MTQARGKNDSVSNETKVFSNINKSDYPNGSIISFDKREHHVYHFVQSYTSIFAAKYVN